LTGYIRDQKQKLDNVIRQREDKLRDIKIANKDLTKIQQDQSKVELQHKKLQDEYDKVKDNVDKAKEYLDSLEAKNRTTRLEISLANQEYETKRSHIRDLGKSLQKDPEYYQEAKEALENYEKYEEQKKQQSVRAVRPTHADVEAIKQDQEKRKIEPEKRTVKN